MSKRNIDITSSALYSVNTEIQYGDKLSEESTYCKDGKIFFQTKKNYNSISYTSTSFIASTSFSFQYEDHSRNDASHELKISNPVFVEKVGDGLEIQTLEKRIERAKIFSSPPILINKVNEISITEDDLYSYALMIKKLALAVGSFNPDLLIAPMRGAEPLFRFLVALLPMHKFKPCRLPFKEGSSKKGRENILRNIEKFISTCEHENVYISIVDTAVGGHSALELLSLFQEVKINSRQRLILDFHFVCAYERLSNLRRRVCSSGEKFVTVTFHDVSSLITEDCDSGLGVCVDNENSSVHDLVLPGEVFLSKRVNFYERYQSPDLFLLVMKLISEKISEDLETERIWIVDNPDLWRNIDISRGAVG